MKEENEYVWLDGMLLKEEHLVKLAMNVGSFALAEHYLCALLAHGLMYGKTEIIDRVNEVRDFYGAPKIPMPGNEISKACRKTDSQDDKARAVFKKMSLDERRKVLRSSLSMLRSNYHLFNYGCHWLGVFLVIRDRLEGESLKMSLNTYKNFGREIDFNDKGEAYYDMEKCPQKEVCDTLWDIIKQMILTTV